jgi:hypothetical protein
VFTCGNNESGQLGLAGKPSDCSQFTQVSVIKDPVRLVSCGGQHTVVLTSKI